MVEATWTTFTIQDNFLVHFWELWPVGRALHTWTHGLPCRFCNGRVMMPPAAAAATSPWMLVRFAVGSVRTSPCWPPSCPAMLNGMRMGWLRAGGPPGITPATAEASCWAVRSGCNTREASLTLLWDQENLLKACSLPFSWRRWKETCTTLEKETTQCKKVFWNHISIISMENFIWTLLRSSNTFKSNTWHLCLVFPMNFHMTLTFKSVKLSANLFYVAPEKKMHCDQWDFIYWFKNSKEALFSAL